MNKKIILKLKVYYTPVQHQGTMPSFPRPAHLRESLCYRTANMSSQHHLNKTLTYFSHQIWRRLGHQTASYCPFFPPQPLQNNSLSLDQTRPSVSTENKTRKPLVIALVNVVIFHFSPFTLKFLPTLISWTYLNVVLGNVIIYYLLFSCFLLSYLFIKSKRNV
jgi:hypothetical protein